MNQIRKLTDKRRLSPSSAKCLVVALFALAATEPAIGQPADLVRTVADGKPWSLTQSDGQTGKVTLNTDGTATMQIGSMRVSPT
jgi:hypothetical protein